jgi:hypothetical protein
MHPLVLTVGHLCYLDVCEYKVIQERVQRSEESSKLLLTGSL